MGGAVAAAGPDPCVVLGLEGLPAWQRYLGIGLVPRCNGGLSAAIALADPTGTCLQLATHRSNQTAAVRSRETI
jgi:hypothetical protein